MKCAVHPEADATGYCRNCGKPMCAICVRPVRDVFYCEDCLATIMGIPAPGTAVTPGASVQGPAAGPSVASSTGLGPHPVLAFFLGFLPGLGAFYNEQYGKGIIHLAIFLFLFITGVDGGVSGGAEAALWICLSALWIYMPVDAYRTARARLAGQTLGDPLESFRPPRRSNSHHRNRYPALTSQLRLVPFLADPAVLAGDFDRSGSFNVQKPSRRTLLRGTCHE
jgi:TM2 domain-containing membrane protein YozV